MLPLCHGRAPCPPPVDIMCGPVRSHACGVCVRVQGLDELSDEDEVEPDHDSDAEGEDLGGGRGESKGPDDDGDDDGDDPTAKPIFMPVSEVESQLKMLWKQEALIVERIWGRKFGTYAKQPRLTEGWAQFFMRAVLVPPNRFRPPQHGIGGGMFEHVQNMFYTKILTINAQLVAAGVGSATGSDGAVTLPSTTPKKTAGIDLSKVVSLWIDLQDNVNRLIDSSKSLSFEGLNSNSGIRQVLERKEGLFRKNMMGKRVNYAARSVISPDPYIGTDQIGVPMRFAKKLTYPEPVTPWNVTMLRDMVVNGPEQHPGANFVEDEAGNLVDLCTCCWVVGAVAGVRFPSPVPCGCCGVGAAAKRSAFQREALAKTLLTQSSSGVAALGVAQAGNGVKRVWRHLKDDDIVLMNRQPTLHKPSIMAHRVRVLRNANEQPLRMHYANCKTYNADFDGDEMNMHFPQVACTRRCFCSCAVCPYLLLLLLLLLLFVGRAGSLRGVQHRRNVIPIPGAHQRPATAQFDSGSHRCGALLLAAWRLLL